MKNLSCILLLAGSMSSYGATDMREVPATKLIPLIAEALFKSLEIDQGKLVLEPSRAMNPVSVPKDRKF